MLNGTVCTIIGHRLQRFKFKYNEGYKLCIRLKKTLTAEIQYLYRQGVHTFWVGGSIGVDTWAAEIILELKKRQEYSDIRLCVALPFPGFKERFDPKQQARLRDVLKACDGQVPTSEVESENAYRIHNEYMINQSNIILAVFDNDHAIHSDIQMAVNYAKKKKIPIILIHPDTANITRT